MRHSWRQKDQYHPYNVWIDPLEKVRVALDEDFGTCWNRMQATPFTERPDMLRDLVGDNADALTALLKATRVKGLDSVD